MRKRREIATCADRAFLRNNRVHTAVEHLAKQRDDIPTGSAEAERQHVRPKQHHCAHFGFGERIANSAGATTDKGQLKLSHLVVRHSNIEDFAEAGVDTENNRVALYNFYVKFSLNVSAV